MPNLADNPEFGRVIVSGGPADADGAPTPVAYATCATLEARVVTHQRRRGATDARA